MRYLIYILCLISCFTFASIGDSSVFRSKFRFDLNYGNGTLIFPYSKSAQQSSNTTPSMYLNLKSINAFEFNFQYCFKSERSKNKFRCFYVGIDYGISIFDFTAGMNDYTGAGHFPSTYHYNNAVLNSYNLMNNIGTSISNYRRESKFFISHQLGLNYSFFSNSTINKSYTETVSSGSPATSPLYITSQNPEGWYWVHNSSVTNHVSTYKFSSSINPFYKFGFGAQLGKFSLYLGFDINYFGNKIICESGSASNSTYELILIKGNGGIAFDL